MRSVLIDIIGRDRASRAFETSAASAESAARRMNAVSAKMARTGAAMTRSVTVPVIAAAAVSVKTAVDFQKSMTLLQTAGGETAKKMTVISSGIQKVAVDTGTSLKDLSEGMYTVAKAGSQKWTAAGQLMVLKAAAQGAKAENVDLATATNALTSVMMSYHLGASQAVRVQNELVVGAGRAKTTMQDYAGALSTVVPVASAAHISFAQVAGAIATMTQHGTSADEATQELSHTIRNLLSPNQVAQKAMQQLGLSVTDVTKNLGKRGLSGTIDLITNAISKHMGPSGMVAVSAFKQSQSAAADLNAELAHMPKSLSGISQQFASGKLSYKDYYKDVKDLGGQAYVMGKQFITAVQQSKGFNDLLKSGSPVARTFAGTLKQVLGTATSMNTALQLGGDNMTYFKKTSDDVAAAARHSGADVLGWAKTQDTLAVKMDKAKASLQVLGLEIGNALIPAVSKIVGWLSKAVDWFEHLSGTQKAIIGWSIAVYAALGPILSIGSRLALVASGIGRFAGGIGTMLGRLTGQTEATQARMATAMRGISSALAGAAIGYTVGQFTRNASTTTKWLGALGSAAAGAAFGFATGAGPLGALIGGVAGGIAGIASAFTNSGKSASEASIVAQQALQAQNDTANTLLETLKSVNGAYGDQVRASVATKLQTTRFRADGKDQGTLMGAATKLGIDPKALVDAALGSQKAFATVQAAFTRYKNAITAGGGVWQGSAEQSYLNGLAKQLGAVSAGTGQGERDWEAYQRGVSGATLASMGLLKALQGTGTNLQGQSFDATRNRDAILAVAKANQEAALKQAAHAKSVQDVITWLNGANGAIKFTTNNLHFNAQAVQGLIDKYKLTPAQIITTMTANIRPGASGAAKLQSIIDAIRQGKVPGLTANSGPGKSVIADLQSRLDGMYQHYVPPVDVDTNPAIAKLNALFASIPTRGFTVPVNLVTDAQHHAAQYRRAGGGAIVGRGTGTSDSILAAVSNGEHVFTASDVEKAGGQGAMYRMRGLIQSGVLRFASGGAVDTSKIGTAIGDIGQGYTKPIDLSSVGINRIRAQIASAWAVLNATIRAGLSSASAASFRAEISSLTAEASKQLAALKGKIAHSDFGAFLTSTASTLADMRTALGTLLSDASNAGAAASALDRVRAAYVRLNSVQAARNSVNDALTAARQKLSDLNAQYQQTYRSAANTSMGTFDVSTAGQVYQDRPATASSILASLATAVANATKFAAVLKSLVKQGLPKFMIAQLVAAGPAALAQAQALAAATPAQILQLSASAGQLVSASKSIGTIAGDEMYGAGIASAQGLVNGLVSKQSALNAAVRRLAQGMVEEIKRVLQIHSPSQVMHRLAGHAVEGYRLGLVQRIGSVQQASKDLANATTPGSQLEAWSSGAGGGGLHVEHLEINEVSDARGTAHAVLRRLSMPGAGSA